MLLVVFQHIRYFSLDLPLESSPFALLFIAFRMPMFFFISGYIAYKVSNYWTVNSYCKKLYTKAKIQLIPTIVFWGIFTYFQIRPWGFPGGFWFTEVLFEMFLIYFSIAFLISRYSSLAEDIFLILIGSSLFYLKNRLANIELSSELCFYELSNYFIFFTLGLLAKKHNLTFSNLINNKHFISIALILPLIILSLIYGPAKLHFKAGFSGLIQIFNGVCLVIVIFTLFRNSSSYWEKQGFIQNGFEFIGRRTLDLYMLHYFLLPFIPNVGKFLLKHNNYILEFITTSILTFVITGIALLISIFIRTSPICAKYLFGVTKK